jgi:hypothetical protein
VLTLTLELLGALEHIHDYERSDFFGTLGYHKHRGSGVRCQVSGVTQLPGVGCQEKEI